MRYQAELSFLQKAFAKCHLRFTLLDAVAPIEQHMDEIGLKEMSSSKVQNLYNKFLQAESNVIYHLTTSYFGKYIYFRLPDQETSMVLVLGPYLSEELTYEQLLEQAEAYGAEPGQFQKIEKFFAGMPVLAADNPLFAILDTFAEHIWGSSNCYTLVEINQDDSKEYIPFPVWDDIPQAENSDWNIATLEMRYAHENELMQAVSLGQTHKAELLLSGFTNLSFERRLSDPVRNLKNYCIIMNTLLRKAAESGGVHPLYLDRISSDFARKIETVVSTEAVQTLMGEMFRNYCRLVKKNATQHYSPPVQKVILHINTNLSGDLSLKSLSATQNMNASYLSALFKKETGQTVTDYVNQMRVHQAERLLGTTKLQIQTVAQHCGISDVNYFSKIFKKYTGKSPIQYRKDIQQQISQVKKS